MNNRYYLIKLLTNEAGQDASSVACFEDADDKTAKDRALVSYHQTLAAYHNASDVLYAVVQIINMNGTVELMEIVDHRPEPEPPEPPEPEPEPEE